MAGKVVDHGHDLEIAVGSGSQVVMVMHTHAVSKPDHKHAVTCAPAHMPIRDARRPLEEEDLV